MVNRMTSSFLPFRIRAGVVLVALWFSLSLLCQARQLQVRGYVTRVISPTSFQVDNYTVIRDDATKLETNQKPSNDNPVVVDSTEIRVGTDVSVKGELNESTSELKAKSIKLFLESSKPVRRSAILSKAPELRKTDKGWQGLLSASGQRISVTDTTLLTIMPSRTLAKDSAPPKSAPQNKPVPLTSVDFLDSNTFLMYEGTRQNDGTILATKIVFQNPEIECGEAKMLKKLTPKIKDPDYAKSKSGELKVGSSKYKLIANKEAQDYISALGRKLIPEHQRQLPDADPLKIPFRFYLVERAFSMVYGHPNGVVVVNSEVFNTYQNEAQIAYLIAREINHVTGKHEWRVDHYHKLSLTALDLGVGTFGMPGLLASGFLVDGIKGGYAESFEEEADCASLQQMLLAGYDVREAPRAWKRFGEKYAEKDSATIWSKYTNDTARIMFLMSEIRANYANVDYSTLVNNSTDYQRVSGIVRKIMYDKRSRVTPLYR